MSFRFRKTDFATANNFSKMSQCSTCHNNKTANSNCETCHTDLSSLRPKTHSFASFKREHGTLINSKNENLCASCHSENDCAKCHDGSQISIISPFEKKGMLSSSSGNNNSKILSGEFVHDINFRFSHGIEAKGKSLKCQTCHREQQFCNDCHQNGSIALGGVIPTSHEQSGFTTLGVNSGGGLHAKLAKRDIESCASCHDADGADPNCIMCHSDTDGILKTNPKTHKDKFFSSIDCDNWRQDENATCYTCHNDANARPNGISGVGFCGYCHGKNKLNIIIFSFILFSSRVASLKKKQFQQSQILQLTRLVFHLQRNMVVLSAKINGIFRFAKIATAQNLMVAPPELVVLLATQNLRDLRIAQLVMEV